MKQCGCNPILEPFEFPILTNYDISYEPNTDGNQYPNLEELCELKRKIICEFMQIMNKLECGIQPDLEFLLLEISLVYIYDRYNAILFK